ncbi:MAG TPA: cytochrome D1 domain-containing protein [Gammaproteobacteria bacterium]|nr:cytochrome D1 domain-containing protein [Gammaproteobacteria bacterium]
MRGRLLAAGACAGAMALLVGAPASAQQSHAGMPMPAKPAEGSAPVLVSDPTSVVMIVDRDSNDIAFMDIKTKKIVGRTNLGKNVNPHMVMMSPDGRYVVTGGTRSNKAYIIDAHTLQLLKTVPVGFAPEHLAFSPDGRYYYQGNPEGNSITVIDMSSLTAIKTIDGLAEPLNITFTPDGQKAYVGNYGAHWVGVIDVTRHELLKKIQVAAPPKIARLDPAEYLSEIHGIFMPAITPDGRYLYAADGDLGLVGVIDTREDKVITTIRVGRDPWRLYMDHEGKYGVVVNNGDETVSIVDIAANKVAATLEAGPNMTGVNFAAGKAFVISSTSGFVYVYDMTSLKPAGRIKIGTNLQLETATTDTADRMMYLASSTDNSIYIIDGRTEAVEQVANVGLFPWGTHIMDSKDNYCH